MRGTGGIVKVLFAVSSVVSPACIPGPALWASQEHSGGAAERADERQEEKRQEVPPETRTVVVTASRREMPLGEVSDVLLVIPRGAIEEIRPSAVGELLGYVPGTSVETGTGSGLPKRSVVSLNGLPASYTLVLVDGQRLLGEHIHTGQNLELVPPECIERIEIIRGAASAQYGADAIGGVVNIITRKCGKAPRTFVGASAGSYHTYGGDVAVLKPFEDWARATIFLSREQSDGVPIEAPASRVGNMGYERNFGTARLHADMGPSTEAFGWVHAADNTADWRGAVADSAMLMTGLGLTHKFSPEVDFNLRLPCSKWEAEVNGEEPVGRAGDVHDVQEPRRPHAPGRRGVQAERVLTREGGRRPRPGRLRRLFPVRSPLGRGDDAVGRGQVGRRGGRRAFHIPQGFVRRILCRGA